MTITDIHSLLGLCNVFRRFFNDFSKFSARLNAELQKGQPEKLDEISKEETEAFESLKAKLSSPPVLELPCHWQNCRTRRHALRTPLPSPLVRLHSEGRHVRTSQPRATTLLSHVLAPSKLPKPPTTIDTPFRHYFQVRKRSQTNRITKEIGHIFS